MFGIGTARQKPLYGAIFDIGSESVGVAIVESDPSTTYPQILFSHRVHMRITKNNLTVEERIRLLKETLFSASLILSRDGIEALAIHNKRARVSKILVTCSAPWSYTISRNVAYENESELKITRELIDDLVASAEAEIAKHIEEGEQPTQLTYEVVERATIDVRINDYSVLHPIGLKGKNVSLVHVTGLVPREVLSALHEVEEKIFPETQVRAHTFMLVLYCILRDIYKEQTAMTVVHVTGDTTEFGIVEGDTLVESVSIPVGLESVIRGMMTNERETGKEMYSLLLLHERGELTDEMHARVEKELNTYKEAISAALDEHAQLRRFPKTAFVLAPAPFTKLFATLLEPVLTKNLGINGAPLILDDSVLNMNANNIADPNLAISSRFFHKLHGCGELANE